MKQHHRLFVTLPFLLAPFGCTAEIAGDSAPGGREATASTQQAVCQLENPDKILYDIKKFAEKAKAFMGEYAFTNWKCGADQYLAGVSVAPATRQPHALLCCELEY